MSHVTAAPHAGTAAGTTTTPTAASQATSKPLLPSSVTHPGVAVHEPQYGNSNAMDESPCTTPYHISSPLRYTMTGGGGSGGGGGRPGCYVSHHSAASFFNYSTSNNAFGGPSSAGNAAGSGGGGGPSRTTSFPSNELQEYVSATSPASDFYYYSPQQFYLESPAPCAAAELYGGSNSGSGSPRTPNFAPGVALPPPMMGSGFCYNGGSSNPHNNTAGSNVEATAANGPHTPSLRSSMSISGSRFPQWYLPRGFYGSSTAGPIYSGGSGYNNYAATAGPMYAADDDALYGEDGCVPPSFAVPGREGQRGLPLPPRLSPQLNPIAVGPFTLPPSVLGAAASSPHHCQSRPQPFVPYDGRAYGLPVYCGLSCAEAAVAIARCALASETNRRGSRRTAATATQQQQQQQASAAAGSDSARPRRLQDSTAVALAADGVARRGSRRESTLPAAGEDAAGVAAAAEEDVSPAEKAPVVDAHTRLTQLRAKANEDAQQQRQQRQQRTRSAPTSPSIAATSAGVKGTVVSAVAAGVRKQLEAEARRLKTAEEEAADEEAELPVSPIPHLPYSEDADTARLEDSLIEEMELASQTRLPSQPPEEKEVEAAVDTKAVLERVLLVPGVKWRHDPYSRRVLVQLSTPATSDVEDEEAAEERGHAADEVDEGRQDTPRSTDSAPSSPPSRLPAHMPASSDVKSRKRPTPDRSEPRGSGSGSGSNSNSSSSAVPTQPPCSPNTSLHSQGSHGECGPGHGNGANATSPKSQPSARRMPIKKICVRHFVSDSTRESRVSADNAVGVLTTVISQPTATQRAAPSRAATEGETAPTNTTATTAAAAVTAAAVAHSDPTAALEKIGCEDCESAAPAPTTQSLVVVPPPCSRQPRYYDHQSKKWHTTPQNATAAASPSDQHYRDGSSYSSSSASSLRDMESVHPAILADPVLQHVGPLPTPNAVVSVKTTGDPASATTTTTADAAARLGTSWAWRARVTQKALDAAAETVSDAVAAAAATSFAMSNGGWNSQVAPLAMTDVDTSLLVRLSRKLTGSGCFRDVMDARQCALGAESNSCTGVVSRTVARRFGSRHGGGGGYDESRAKCQQLTMVTEVEVTHVYVLQHRYRTSCAVATRRYDHGTEVVLDGDMGVETGVVQLVLTKTEYYTLTPHERQVAGLALTLDAALSSSIHRCITAEERLVQATVQRPLEDVTLAFVRYLSTQPHLFHSCRIDCMSFVDVEFQADGQKLYVFYHTSATVRFLELATYLNHVFHCRIWMKLAKGR